MTRACSDPDAGVEIPDPPEAISAVRDKAGQLGLSLVYDRRTVGDHPRPAPWARRLDAARGGLGCAVVPYPG
jgi:hypothetical protein